MYQPLKVGMTSSARGNVTVMSPTGENDRDLPQLLDVKYAQNIINYIIYGEGRLEKRKGYTELFDASSNNAITFMEWLTSDIIIFGYSTTIARPSSSVPSNKVKTFAVIELPKYRSFPSLMNRLTFNPSNLERALKSRW